MMNAKTPIIASFFALQMMAGQADATMLYFDNITGNNAINAATGEAQLSVDVSEVMGGVQFSFSNSGPNASSITDIYFDDDLPFLMTFDSFISSQGVDFGVGANPGDVPGGNAYSFSSNYSYDSNPSAQQNGVNPGEALTIVFDFANSYDFDDIRGALANQSMRIGIHVQGFANGGSESFINTVSNPVPEPTTMLLFGTGLAGLAGVARRKKKA